MAPRVVRGAGFWGCGLEDESVFRTKADMTGWKRVAPGEYHKGAFKVRKLENRLWEVSGPTKNDGHQYETRWAAVSAADGTPASFK